ncbi:LpqN/LpqT family lipoprotein [Mycolicibacterium elephantis]|uniref:LpqN/LpqT family lipoprotein n=1 Tax=Mycolicibacterium elephantis TaxID=81858 RepID=UPI003A83CE80
MIEIARHWRVLASGAAVAAAGVVGFAGPTASADPVLPQPPMPAPATVTQTVTVTPNAAPQALGQPGVSSATGAAQAGVASPAAPAAAPAAPAAAAPVAAAVDTPPPVAITPAASGTLREFLESKGVTLEPQKSQGFTALNIVLPMPRGWSYVPDPNVPDAFAVIADRVGGNGLYTSNAAVTVYKLIGDFDPIEAISHGFVDSQQLPAWRSTDASFASFGGMPSALIEGTYRENAMTLNTSRRHVIATAGPDRYLVSLAVTTSLDQVVPAAEATDAIVRGFRVSVPAPAAPPAPAPPAPGAAPAPAALPATPAPPSVPAAASQALANTGPS